MLSIAEQPNKIKKIACNNVYKIRRRGEVNEGEKWNENIKWNGIISECAQQRQCIHRTSKKNWENQYVIISDGM